MKIAVVAPEAVPHAVGGAERLCDGLVSALNERGHDATLVRRPTPERSFRQLVDSYDAFGRLDLSEFDEVISTKYPSWMVRHPRHRVYLLHPLRGLYDSYPLFGQPKTVADPNPSVRRLLRELQAPPGRPGTWIDVIASARRVLAELGDAHPSLVFPGPLIRRLIHWLDRDALDPRNIVSYAAISRTVADRADYFPPGVPVSVLWPPTTMTGLRPGSTFGHFFTASRLDPPKRLELLIDAMAHVPGPIQLRIAGTGPAESELKARAAADERIQFLGRISDEQLISEYAQALAVPFVPFDEDFGLVTLEAQLAGKPVVTTTDSGGVNELVTDLVSGRVVPPDSIALGQALLELSRSVPQARLMGAAGRRRALTITWDHVVDGLLDPPVATTPGPAVRPKVVVLSTYPAHPARHGGQLRLNRLLRGLTDRFEVDLITVDHGVDQVQISTPFPGLRQLITPAGPEYAQLEGRLASRSPIPIGDIAAALFAERAPELVRVLRESTRDAIGAVLEQPYLLPLLRRIRPDLPFVYDSQNAEVDLKQKLLGDAEHAETFLEVVRSVEQTAVTSAELVGACSTEDRDRLIESAPSLAEWVLIPNGSDVVETPFVTGVARADNRNRWLDAYAEGQRHRPAHLAVFVGSYHPPNIEAAELIVRLAPSWPDICFAVVGQQGAYFANWALPPNVLVTGMIAEPELLRLLHAADFALNPIRSGGGTNLKLIEYFAAGVPVLSSPLGTRGIAVADGVELLIREWSDTTAGIAALLADPDAAAERAGRARTLAETGYDWHPIGAAYAAAVEMALVRSS